jgi:hypothetical protein
LLSTNARSSGSRFHKAQNDSHSASGTNGPKKVLSKTASYGTVGTTGLGGGAGADEDAAAVDDAVAESAFLAEVDAPPPIPHSLRLSPVQMHRSKGTTAPFVTMRKKQESAPPQKNVKPPANNLS